MVEFKTERCNIRRFQKEDIHDFAHYRNNENWMRYQGFKGLEEDEYEYILLQDFSLEEGVQLAIASLKTNKLIGDLFLNQYKDELWIAYTINPDFAKQNYSKEVLLGLIEWVKTQDIKKIYAGLSKENTPASTLLQELQFTHTETNEDNEDIYLLNI